MCEIHISEVIKHIPQLFIEVVAFLAVTFNIGFPGPPPPDFATFMTCTQNSILSNTECQYKMIKSIIKTSSFINLTALYGII